jgi:hypothetical protein
MIIISMLFTQNREHSWLKLTTLKLLFPAISMTRLHAGGADLWSKSLIVIMAHELREDHSVVACSCFEYRAESTAALVTSF